MTTEKKTRVMEVLKWMGMGGIVILLGFFCKTIIFVDNTADTNRQLPQLKIMFNEFKMDVNIQITEIKTTLKDFILQHKEEEQIRTQQTIRFQAEQIRVLKEKNRETADIDTNYVH